MESSSSPDFQDHPACHATSRLQSGYSHPLSRKWNSVHDVTPDNLMLPLFITDSDPNAKQVIPSMPGVFRLGLQSIVDYLKPIVQNGLCSVLLFGVPTKHEKTTTGSIAATQIVSQAVKVIKKAYPNLYVACDVCLCAYTTHGHCGVFHDSPRNGEFVLDNGPSRFRIAQIALEFAKAGADCVAPSDMMDGRIEAIKSLLFKNKLDTVTVMSYSAKYASCFYGPFRDAAHSAPSTPSDSSKPIAQYPANRKSYQLPPGSQGLGVRAMSRDVKEGADILMIKPGLPYLDLLQIGKKTFDVPMAVYQVSGEFAMLYHGAKANAFKLKDAVLETCTSFKRSGATIIITYFTPEILEWIKYS